MKKILLVVFDVLALAVILYFFYPLAKDYFLASPPYGGDFLNYTSYMAYVRDHFRLPPASWHYIWFSGFPGVFDSPWSYYYLALPLTKFFSAINSFRVFMMITLFLQLTFSYLFIKRFAKNTLVALFLTLTLGSSVNFYMALWGGGTAGSAAGNFFLPFTLWLITKHFQEGGGSNKYLFLAGLTMGFACLGHVGILPLVIFGPATLFFFFWIDGQNRFLSLKKIGLWLVVSLITLGVASVTLYIIVNRIFTLPAGFAQFGVKTKVQADALIGMVEHANPFIFPFAAFFVLLAVLRRKFIKFGGELPALLSLVFYILVSCVLYQTGHHPMSQAMGPDRVWWILSLGLAALTGYLWRQVFGEVKGKLLSKANLATIVSILVFVPLVYSFYLPSFREHLTKHTSHVGYPTRLMDAVIKEDKETIKKVMVPPFMDPDSTQYRSYSLMPAIETWWNVIFKLPQAKGYYHMMGAQANSWLYWVDNTLLGEYVWHFKVPETIAKQHALWLIDWYAIHTFEGGGLPIAPYLLSDASVVDSSMTMNKEDSEPVIYNHFADEITSPIIHATNTPVVLVVGNEVGYDAFLKNLATQNLNSRYLIPVRGPEEIEDIKDYNLKDFDLVFLYNYRYRNERDFKSRDKETWTLLEKYVQAGGNLIIETGGEVIETNSSVLSAKNLNILPTVFPIEQTIRAELGQSWDLTVNSSPVTEGIDFGKFAQLVYEKAPWKLSYAVGVRSWGKTVLAQAGRPILVEGTLGKGKVIWSGINFPYHFLYHLNYEESRFTANILKALVPLNREEDNKKVTITRPTPEKITVTGSGFKGIIFKETFFEGWTAKILKPVSKNLTIYKAGPYFMYVRLPGDTKGEIVLKLLYKGPFIGWFLFFLSIITFGATLWLIVFEKKIGAIIAFLRKKFGFKIGRWWDKDDDE